MNPGGVVPEPVPGPVPALRREALSLRLKDIDATCHTLQHSFATLLLMSGYDIRILLREAGSTFLAADRLWEPAIKDVGDVLDYEATLLRHQA